MELIAVDLEAVLAADEGETVAELEQKRLQLVHQGGLEVAFGDRLGQVEEVQQVGIADHRLGQLGVGRRQRRGEV